MKRLCNLEDIDNFTSKGFTLEQQSLFAVRQNHQVYVYRNRCPHLGIPLEFVADRFLDIDAELIQCSTHGALFMIDNGLCVSGPCSGQSLQSLETRITNGEVWVTLGERD